jgi:hypothetical protein
MKRPCGINLSTTRAGKTWQVILQSHLLQSEKIARQTEMIEN